MLYFNQLDQLLDNGPCQKGRVMMISFAFFQASCAWSAMAILVMICVFKKKLMQFDCREAWLGFWQNVFSQSHCDACVSYINLLMIVLQCLESCEESSAHMEAKLIGYRFIEYCNVNM